MVSGTLKENVEYAANRLQENNNIAAGAALGAVAVGAGVSVYLRKVAPVVVGLVVAGVIVVANESQNDGDGALISFLRRRLGAIAKDNPRIRAAPGGYNGNGHNPNASADPSIPWKNIAMWSPDRDWTARPDQVKVALKPGPWSGVGAPPGVGILPPDMDAAPRPPYPGAGPVIGAAFGPHNFDTANVDAGLTPSVDYGYPLMVRRPEVAAFTDEMDPRVRWPLPGCSPQAPSMCRTAPPGGYPSPATC